MVLIVLSYAILKEEWCLETGTLMVGLMEMHQIRYFLAVTRRRSFSAAARECHVSQPSLSQQIMKLEEEMGERLFERLPQGAKLTPAGKLFLPYAERIAGDVEEALLRVSESGSVARGRLVLGVLPTIAPFLLPRMLRSFLPEHPEVEVVVQEEITPRLLEGVYQGGIDLALLSLPVPGAGLESRELFSERLLLVVPQGHALAAKPEVMMRDIASERFILMQEGHCLADQALEFCHTKGDFQPSVTCRSAQVQTLLALVEAGLGLSIVPEMAMRPELGVVYRELTPRSPRRKIGLVWRKSKYYPMVLRSFVDWATAAGLGR